MAGLVLYPVFALGPSNFFLWNETDYFGRIDAVVIGNLSSAQTIYGPQFPAVLRDNFPFEVSNLLFLERMLQVPATTAAAIELCGDMILTAIGIFWLARFIARLQVTMAATAALFGSAGQFYFHSFLEGHIGSIIYGSYAPYLAGLLIFSLVHSKVRETLVPLVLLGSAMELSYHPVLYLLAVPLVLIRLTWMTAIYLRKILANVGRTTTYVDVRGFFFLMFLAISIAAAIVFSGIISRAFYPSRISFVLHGSQPSGFMITRYAIDWFFGVSLAQGFDYGQFLTPSDLHLYYSLVSTLAWIAVAATVLSAVPLLMRPTTSYFVSFMLLVPLVSLVFYTELQNTYYLAKVCYIHYGLIVIALLCCLQSLIKTSRYASVLRTIYIAVLVPIGALNLVSSVLDDVVTTKWIGRSNVAAAAYVASWLKQQGIRSVYLHSDSDLYRGIMLYAMESADVTVMNGMPALKDLVVTAQNGVYSKVPKSDVIYATPKGDYVVSRRPSNYAEIQGNEEPDVRDRIFQWLDSPSDYYASNFSSAVEAIRRAVARERPGQRGAICNDLSDSGYYVLVQSILRGDGLTRSDWIRDCSLFVRLSSRLTEVSAKISSDTGLVQPIRAFIGVPRSVSSALDPGQVKKLQSGDLLDLWSAQRSNPALSQPVGIDLERLLSVVRRSRLAVYDSIPPSEYERSYFDYIFAKNGVRLVSGRSGLQLGLVMVPSYSRSFVTGHLHTLWQSSRAFEEREKYFLALTDAQSDRRLGASLIAAEAADVPLRARLGPTQQTFLELRVPDESRRLNVLIERGPSLSSQVSIFRAFDRDGLSEPGYYKISGPNGLIEIPTSPFVRHQGVTIVSLEPMLETEQPIVVPYGVPVLSFKLVAVAVTGIDAAAYPAEFLSQLNEKPGQDIVAAGNVGIKLGIGWYSRESQNGAMFRWLSRQADIVVDRATLSKTRKITLEGLRGPSADGRQFFIKCSLNGQRIASHLFTTGPAMRLVISIPGSYGLLQERTQAVIHLTTLGGDRPLKTDPRYLNYRVFSIAGHRM